MRIRKILEGKKTDADVRIFLLAIKRLRNWFSYEESDKIKFAKKNKVILKNLKEKYE